MKRSLPVLCVLALAGGAALAECPPVPPAMRDIKAQGYYIDSKNSIVDEDKRRQNLEMTKPLNDYLRRIAEWSDDRQQEGQGACAAAWLDGWAAGGALLGEMVHVNNDQSDYMRQWELDGAAIVYLKVKAVATPEQRARIEPWLAEIARRNLDYWGNPKRHRNNHYYWTGVGVLATGTAIGDQALIEQGKAIYRKGLGDIEDDGTLPMEMARGEKALHYHNYALAPLVMMAEIGTRLTGEDWYGWRDRRIDLLAERVLSGWRDSAFFAKATGLAQEKLAGHTDLGWVEFYRRRAPRPERFEDLHQAGPYDEPRLGGNLTLMADKSGSSGW
ncbi:MAG TPA: alginate lyase family protein [Magnetospirillaceae bacterium]|nr:alginate lyase family protein [Magnetospirillaceae bacterium]